MELSYNSTSSKLYRWFYDKHDMPETLCPYFWKLVFAWTITIILSPLLLPKWIVDKLSKNDEHAPVPVYAFLGFLIYGAIFIIASLFVFFSAYWITYYEKDILYGMYVGGLVAFVIGLGASIAFGIKYLIDKRKEKLKEFIWDEFGDYVKNPDYIEPKPNLLAEFIKAKYHKYCPKIDWK